MAAAGGLDTANALEHLVLEDFEKTHPKVSNPNNFRLPRKGALILRDKVHKEGQEVKSIKERLMQLTISADNHVELAYTECGGQGQVPNRWKNVIRLSRGPGSQWADTKNGRGEFTHCLRIDLPMQVSPPMAAYKLVLCFRNTEDRQRWKDAFAWADKRNATCKQHDDYVQADEQAAAQEAEAERLKRAEAKALLQAELAETTRIAEELRLQQEELQAAKEQLLAEKDQVQQAVAAEQVRVLEERVRLQKEAEVERQRLIKARQDAESYEAKLKADAAKLQSQQEDLQRSLNRDVKAFTEKDGVGGFVAALQKK